MPPSQKGWLTTLRAIKGVWDYLYANGFASLRTRALNQDPLENFFGAIRSGCGGADNPTIVQFVGSMKTQIINGLSTNKLGGNCEEDESSLLTNLQAFLNEGAHNVTNCDNVNNSTMATKVLISAAEAIATDVTNGNRNILSVAYVGGFIMKHLLSAIQNCNDCKQIICGNEEDPHNLFISFKEFSTATSHLNYPSGLLVTAVGIGVTLIENFLNEASCYKKIAQIFKLKKN
ncbi:hypothetical protein ABEB36_008897 [Hypothenemus hampei]|uniref:Transposable element P transposase-like RNase H C-terminal domain-containing protein n=1 Tax=Hypothenemus hampei TaxID=57062 RepID=A0ABD1ENG0_HYPHA